MDATDKEHAILRYAKRTAEFGPTAQALGWRDREQQELRFQILAEIGDLDGKSVLDVGCGFGDFYDYVAAQGKQVDYVGVDISPDLLAVARERHPQARFEERDILMEPMQEHFDYVIESGVFNHILRDNEGFVRQMLASMFEMSRVGMAANMMTTHVDYQEEQLHYYDPDEYIDYCKTLSPHVAIRQDYPLYEFTIYTYRSPASVPPVIRQENGP